MTKLEKTMLANLLQQYQAENNPMQNVSRETLPNNNSLEYLLSQGYTLHPPQSNTHPQQQATQSNSNDNIIENIIKGLQLSNVMTMQQPQQPQSTDDIIASIINPPLPEFGSEPNGGIVNGK